LRKLAEFLAIVATNGYEPEVMCVPIFANFALMMVPSAGIADTSANAIAEAMRAYSIAVAPESFPKNVPKVCMAVSYKVGFFAI
jgi:hypothetical protein